ncbi:MAG: hypothetical protein DMF06_03325 [Verrucomicrobia bacterium]|nr:MAG: hypothetical protein DMF06_03325 [Verrucomicrobiota bacterium]
MKLTKMAAKAINPAAAEELLKLYPYERQRSVNQSYVESYASTMTKGEWLPGSEIAIAFSPNGDGQKHGHLVNGRHRLLAVIESGASIEFAIKEFDCADSNEVANLYGLTDTGRQRNINDHIRALALDEEFGLSLFDNSKLSAAVALINGDFRPHNKNFLLPSIALT